ncbi:MAG TPA: hypothetical protein VLP43_04075 [Solirubrobacteraceae bacterium]|nr:hypothetical protein [Solirubrobacteraceae bacterium]
MHTRPAHCLVGHGFPARGLAYRIIGTLALALALEQRAGPQPTRSSSTTASTDRPG